MKTIIVLILQIRKMSTHLASDTGIPHRPRRQPLYLPCITWQALRPGVESPSTWETSKGWKGSQPLAHHTRHAHMFREPGVNPFIDGLILGQGFVGSRAASSLQSIESQPSIDTRVYKKEKKKKI